MTLIFQGPAVWQGEENVRIQGWLEDDGSAKIVFEMTSDAGDDATVEIPATSVGLDLRVALGLTPKITQRNPPPASVFKRSPRAARAKRSWES